MHNEYIFATATVEVWEEEVFAAAFNIYEVRKTAAAKETVTTVIRAKKEYSHPIELDSHTSAVFINTVDQFPPQNLMQISNHDSEFQVAPNMATQSDSDNIIIYYGYVTPAFINQYYYNVSNNNISSKATQAL